MDYAPDGKLKKWSHSAISAAAEYPGEADKFVLSLIESGWIDNNMKLHDWNHYGGKCIKANKLASERQRKHRLEMSRGDTRESRVSHALRTRESRVSHGVDKIRLEKSREERKNRARAVVPQVAVAGPAKEIARAISGNSADSPEHPGPNGESYAEFPSFAEWQAAASMESLTPVQIQAEWDNQERKTPAQRWKGIDRTRLRRHAAWVLGKIRERTPPRSAAKAFARELPDEIEVKKLN
jgi:hypothetical protein